MNSIPIVPTLGDSVGIELIKSPISANVSLKSHSPFSISVTANTVNYNDVKIALYAENSKSLPYHPDLTNSWEKLKPQWRFIYADGKDTPINVYADVSWNTKLVLSNGTVYGAIGTLDFYYIDDISTDFGVPVMITATMDSSPYADTALLEYNANVSGYSNSLASVTVPFYVLPVVPGFLHFSQNGKYELDAIQWTGLNIPAYATIHGILPLEELLLGDGSTGNYPILFEQPSLSGSVLEYKIDILSGDNFITDAEFKKHIISSGVADGGWAKVDITPYEMSPAAKLIGRTTISYDAADISWRNSQTSTSTWIANSEIGALHNLTTAYISADSAKIRPLLENKYGNVYGSMYNRITTVSGSSVINAITVNPDDNCVWVSDTQVNVVHKLNNSGEIIFSIDLPSAANSIAVDSNATAYVSLSANVSCMQIVKSGDTGYSNSIIAPTGTGFNGYHTVKVVTDQHNGIHVAYGNGSNSGFAYFPAQSLSGNAPAQSGSWKSTAGSFIIEDFVVLKSGVDDILIFAAAGGSSAGVYEQIFSYNTNTYSAPSLLVSCPNPIFVAFSENATIWFAYDLNKIGKLDSLSSHSLSAVSAMVIPHLPALNANQIIGGIGIDNNQYVNVIQAYSNDVYRWYAEVDPGDVSSVFYTVHIEPKTTTGASLRAFGDWTGKVYDYTYSVSPVIPSSSIVTVELSGSSQPFAINSFPQQYGLRRFNDSFDMCEQIKSYILPDFQKQFVSLWDDLIGNTVGNASSDYQSFGRQFYEKIANFVINHSSITTSNIDAIYSNLNSIGIEYTNYNLEYPADVKLWMNILSIAFESLRGEEFRCNRNFQPATRALHMVCENCGNIHSSNLGAKLESSDMMVVGTPVVIEDTFKSSGAFDIFYPPISGDFSQLENYGFRSPFKFEYNVYNYVPNQIGTMNAQAEGLINWEPEARAAPIATV